MLIAFLFLVFLLTLSWLVTCGIVYLIALCFNFTFTWAIATGIWLILFLLGGLFNKGR